MAYLAETVPAYLLFYFFVVAAAEAAVSDWAADRDVKAAVSVAGYCLLSYCFAAAAEAAVSAALNSGQNVNILE